MWVFFRLQFYRSLHRHLLDSMDMKLRWKYLCIVLALSPSVIFPLLIYYVNKVEIKVISSIMLLIFALCYFHMLLEPVKEAIAETKGIIYVDVRPPPTSRERTEHTVVYIKRQESVVSLLSHLPHRSSLEEYDIENLDPAELEEIERKCMLQQNYELLAIIEEEHPERREGERRDDEILRQRVEETQDEELLRQREEERQRELERRKRQNEEDIARVTKEFLEEREMKRLLNEKLRQREEERRAKEILRQQEEERRARKMLHQNDKVRRAEKKKRKKEELRQAREISRRRFLELAAKERLSQTNERSSPQPGIDSAVAQTSFIVDVENRDVERNLLPQVTHRSRHPSSTAEEQSSQLLEAEVYDPPSEERDRKKTTKVTKV